MYLLLPVRLALSYVLLSLIIAISFELKEVTLTFVRLVCYELLHLVLVCKTISPSVLKDSFAKYTWLAGFFFFSFCTLNISCNSLLVSKISVDKYAHILMGFPCMLQVVFSWLLLIVHPLLLTI